jgi:hypothetical protein
MMRLVSENGDLPHSFPLTSGCVEVLRAALVGLQPTSNEDDRKRRLMLALIEDHMGRDEARRALYR